MRREDSTSGEEATQPVVLKEWTAQDFSDMYVRYYPLVLSHARKFLTNHAQAEEVTQEAFFYLIHSLPEVDSEIGVLRLLKWKTRLLALDVIRAESRAKPIPIDEVQYELGVDEPDPSELVTRADDAAIVQLALAKLTPKQRQVLIESVYLEKSHAETAAKLGMEENATRQLLHRAKASFRKALVGEAQTAGLSVSEILSIATKKASRDLIRNSKYIASVVVVALSLALVPGALVNDTGSTQLANNSQNSEADAELNTGAPGNQAERPRIEPADEANQANGQILTQEDQIQQSPAEIAQETSTPGLEQGAITQAPATIGSDEGQTEGSLDQNDDSQPEQSRSENTTIEQPETASKPSLSLGDLLLGVKTEEFSLTESNEVFGLSASQIPLRLDFSEQMYLVVNLELATGQISSPVLHVEIDGVELIGVPKLTEFNLQQGSNGEVLSTIKIQDFYATSGEIVLPHSWITNAGAKVTITLGPSAEEILKGEADLRI